MDLVVNYDFPHKAEAYVHRIGRTGRAGRAGLAISLCEQRDQANIEAVQQFTQTVIDFETLPPANPACNMLLRNARMDTLRIAAGRRDKLRPGDILGALTGETGGFSAEAIGKIEIHDRFSYVAIAAEVCVAVLSSLREGRIKGKRFKVELVP